MEARILAGEFHLAEAAAAVLAMQRVEAYSFETKYCDFTRPPTAFSPFCNSRPGFRRAPQMLMAEVWQEVASSTNPWAPDSPLPAAVGPALLALDLSMWAAPPWGGFYWELPANPFATTAASSTGQLPPPSREDGAGAGLVSVHDQNLIALVPCLQALQQVIEGVAGNLACFSPDELAEAAYGLLLLGCNPASPDSSLSVAAELAARAAVDARVAANEGSNTIISSSSSSSSSGAYSGGKKDNRLATKWPVLQLKVLPAVAPLLQEIYQQLLLVVEQQLMRVAAGATPSTAAASGVLDESVSGHWEKISAAAAADAGVVSAGILSDGASGVTSSTSSSFRSSGSMATRRGTDKAILYTQQQQQQQLAKEVLASGTAVRAVVVLLGSGLWSPGVEAAEKLAALTAEKLHQMTWRERAQGKDVVEFCLAAVSAATAAAVDDGGGGADGSSRGSGQSGSGLEEVRGGSRSCKRETGGALIAKALYIECSPVGNFPKVPTVSSSSSGLKVLADGLPLKIRAWLREFEGCMHDGG